MPPLNCPGHIFSLAKYFGKGLIIDKARTAARLHSAAIGLLRSVRTQDVAMGLSPARASVLSILVFGGTRTLSQLTSAEQVAAPTMTKLIAGLERGGFVKRHADAGDGRVWHIEATAKARRTLERGRDRRIAHLLELLDGLDSAEWAAVEAAVRSIEGALGRVRN